jgi:hypothetical protein
MGRLLKSYVSSSSSIERVEPKFVQRLRKEMSASLKSLNLESDLDKVIQQKRLDVFRHAFAKLTDELTTYGPILKLIQAEYEMHLKSAKNDVLIADQCKQL